MLELKGQTALPREDGCQNAEADLFNDSNSSEPTLLRLQAKEDHLKAEMLQLAKEEGVVGGQLAQASKHFSKASIDDKVALLEAKDEALVKRMRELADEEWAVEGSFGLLLSLLLPFSRRVSSSHRS